MNTSSEGDANLHLLSDYTGTCRFATATATEVRSTDQASTCRASDTSEFRAAIALWGWSWPFAPVGLGATRLASSETTN